MKNTFGQNISVTLFGESHGGEIGVVIDGLSPGIKIDESYIEAKLALRRPSGKISTGRREADEFRIVSGAFEGRTTGTPLCVIIPNKDTRSGDYSKLKDLPRPSHADYTAMCKYHGYADYRGGGHFSGRLTAPLVAAGSILMKALEDKGIRIGTHIASVGNIKDKSFDPISPETDLVGADFPTLSREAGESMKAAITEAASDGDSLGGILETAVVGVPEGVGEPWFDSVEGLVSHAVFSIPGVKGIEFGRGFEITTLRGSEANDGLCLDGERVVTSTNNSGGINGGITNGMPILFRTAIKPTPSIFKTQATVDISTNKETELSLSGRHDPAIIHRARVVVDAVTAIVVSDMLCGRYGTDYLAQTKVKDREKI